MPADAACTSTTCTVRPRSDAWLSTTSWSSPAAVAAASPPSPSSSPSSSSAAPPSPPVWQTRRRPSPTTTRHGLHAVCVTNERRRLPARAPFGGRRLRALGGDRHGRGLVEADGLHEEDALLQPRGRRHRRRVAELRDRRPRGGAPPRVTAATPTPRSRVGSCSRARPPPPPPPPPARRAARTAR